MIKIEPIEAFTDNYIWLVTTNEGSIAIDPGESLNTIKFLDKNFNKDQIFKSESCSFRICVPQWLKI